MNFAGMSGGVSQQAFQELTDAVNTLHKQAKRAEDRKTAADGDLQYQLNVMNARDAWQDSKADNVETGFPVKLRLYIPEGGDTRSIKRVLLSIWLDAFRSYGTAAASANLGTVSISSSTTSSGGGSSSGASSITTTGPSLTTTSGPSSTSVTSENLHQHTFGDAPTDSADGSVGLHTHHMPIDTTWATGSHSHGMDHTHQIPSHTHDLSHYHTISSHVHDMSHSHTIGSHSHALTHGIYTGTTASGCTILINTMDRTTAVVGAATFSVDQTALDITQYVVKGLNTIEITSATLGRIDAMVFANVYLNK